MANIPTPRSYNVILGDLIDTFLSETGIPGLPDGDPILSILEAAAQSDLRTSQDIFQFLTSLSLDKASGTALERIGAEEGLVKFTEFPATGTIDISDVSFTKKQTSVYQGKSAPIIGTTTLYVVSALDWPTTGQLYIGRGTNQYEGPIGYSATSNLGTYWTITLSTGTQKFHNHGESVIHAQGGNRLVTSGTVVETPQGNTGTSVQFSLLHAATLPDGETSIDSVPVVAKKPGIIGNVSAGAIVSFTNSPFTGATVTNSVAFSNGRSAEDDKTFRDRIRLAKQSRSKGTSTAIKNAVNGVYATDESKRVISSSIVAREGYPTTLYIDDGSGYEEKTGGVPYEVIVDSAFGGEQYLSLANGRPVAKAFAISNFESPFILTSGSKLAAVINGVTYEHAFNVEDFLSISNATAYEVVSSINGDSTVKFSARTANNGKNVAIFADEDTNEELEVVIPSSGVDANEILGFNAKIHDTLKLYRNDRLLTKDGELASLVSNPQSQWATLSSGETLKIVIDGVNISGISDTYTITDADFINARTSYSIVSVSNSLDSWATVLNFKIPGVNFTANNGALRLTSNLGRSGRASLDIQGGTLVSKNMFTVGSSQGRIKDYTFNRNLGQIRLEDDQVLVAGDKLSTGTYNTRAFIESSIVPVSSIIGSAELWFCVDGDARIISTGIQAGTTLTYSVTSSPSWGDRVRITTATAFFGNVQVGDWLIVNDPSSAPDKGAFRIVTKDGSNFWIEIERPTSYVASGAVALTTDGFKVVRTSTEPQRIAIAAGGNFTAYNFVQSLNASLVGATASVYKTNKIRVYTNTYDLSGDIALVLTDTEGAKLKLPVSNAITNLDPHVASVLSSNGQAGTPSFAFEQISAVTSTTVFDATGIGGLKSGDLIVATRPIDDGIGRYSNFGHVSSIDNITGSTITIRTPVLQHWLPEDLFYHASAYSLNAYDKLVATIDQDTVSNRYDINLYRKVTPGSSTYGLSNDLKDADNGNASLALGFGTDFDWKDFAVWMKARTKSNLLAGANTTKTILWRYFKHGPEGNAARFQYRYPPLSNQTVNFSVDNTASASYSNIKVTLPTGAPRTGYTIRGSTKIGVAGTNVTAGLYTYYNVLGFDIASASRTTNITTLILTLPGPITDHGLAIGNQIYVNSTSGSFTSGVKILTNRSATTVSYSEVAANVGATPTIGSLSNDTSGEATLSGSTVVAGDIFGFKAPGVSVAEKIATLGTRYWSTTSDVVNGITTTLNWFQVGDPAYLSFYPINTGTNTAALIASGINGLANCPLTAVAVGGGAGQIADATYEATPLGEGATDPWYYLTDGINFVRSHSTPVSTSVDFNFTFKDAITATLATDSDWAAEDVRLVPTTAKNVVRYLGSPATSGLSSVASVQISADGQNPQISSSTIGSSGSVQVQGGSGNALTATALSSAVDVTPSMLLSFKSSDLDGLSGRMWVALDNTFPVPKAGRITSSTALTSLDSLGNFTLSGTNAWDWATTAPGVVTGSWQIVKQGKFVQIRCLTTTFPGVLEGDLAFIKFTGSTANNGTFRVVRQRGDADFWIENPNAVEERVTASTVAFVKYNSIVPGDVISINTTLWGANNTGDRVVETIDLPSPFGGTGSLFKFKTKESATVFTGPVSLGASYNLVQAIEGAPSRLIKHVLNIATSGTAGIWEVKFDTDSGYSKTGAFAGTVMSPLDKLGFSNDISNGTDGYSKHTGLLAEVNKVVYGLEADPSTYPGVAAAGTQINIAGPLIKRISVTLSIRTVTGIDRSDIESEVKSQVASVINKSPVGVPVAIGTIISAAQSVNGVMAVSILSPTYNVSSDLIPIQPFEKPLVLNLDTDILVSFTGA